MVTKSPSSARDPSPPSSVWAAVVIPTLVTAAAGCAQVTEVVAEPGPVAWAAAEAIVRLDLADCVTLRVADEPQQGPERVTVVVDESILDEPHDGHSSWSPRKASIRVQEPDPHVIAHELIHVLLRVGNGHHAPSGLFGKTATDSWWIPPPLRARLRSEVCGDGS